MRFWLGHIFTIASCLAGMAAIAVSAGCAETGASRRDRSMFPEHTTVTVYDDHADAERLRDRLTALRAHFGRGPAAPFTVGQTSLTYAKNDVAKGLSPETAFENSARASADDGERTVRWWCLGTDHLETFEFPQSFIIVAKLSIAIAIVRSADPGGRRYYVLLMSPSFTDNTFAFDHSAGSPRTAAAQQTKGGASGEPGQRRDRG